MRQNHNNWCLMDVEEAPHLNRHSDAERVEALGIVNQELDVDQAAHRGRLLPADNGDQPRSQVQPSGISVISTDRRQDPRTNLPTTTLKPDMIPTPESSDLSLVTVRVGKSWFSVPCHRSELIGSGMSHRG
jgi:hypothetical protein